MKKISDLISDQKLYGNLESKPFSVRRWIKNNIVGILGTLIFHVFLLIIFLVIKINSLKEIHELGVTLDFTQIETQQELTPEKTLKLTADELAYLDNLLSQQSVMSNMASNVAEKLEKELSTENYVDQVEKELDQARSEEWRRQQEELQKKLLQEDYVPEVKNKPKDDDIDNFKGLTNITYEFLEAPFNRYKTYLPVPVYKCLGEGTVLVDISVDQTGKVVSSKAYVQKDFPDKNCMIEVAEKYALLTQFEGKLSAPKAHKARIVYKFISQ